MRSTKAPPRDFAALWTDDVSEGEKLFREQRRALGCAICHHPDHTTPPAGTPIQASDIELKPGQRHGDRAGGPGNKVIHPYSDFLLHDVGTGDGIAQTQHAQKPPRGIENLAKIPDEVMLRRGSPGPGPPPLRETGGASAPTSRASTRGPST